MFVFFIVCGIFLAHSTRARAHFLNAHQPIKTEFCEFFASTQHLFTLTTLNPYRVYKKRNNRLGCEYSSIDHNTVLLNIEIGWNLFPLFIAIFST